MQNINPNTNKYVVLLILKNENKIKYFLSPEIYWSLKYKMDREDCIVIVIDKKMFVDSFNHLTEFVNNGVYNGVYNGMYSLFVYACNGTRNVLEFTDYALDHMKNLTDDIKHGDVYGNITHYANQYINDADDYTLMFMMFFVFVLNYLAIRCVYRMLPKHGVVTKSMTKAVVKDIVFDVASYEKYVREGKSRMIFHKQILSELDSLYKKLCDLHLLKMHLMDQIKEGAVILKRVPGDSRMKSLFHSKVQTPMFTNCYSKICTSPMNGRECLPRITKKDAARKIEKIFKIEQWEDEEDEKNSGMV